MEKLYQYTNARTCMYNINYHFVWCTKKCRKLLTTDVTKKLSEILAEVGKDKGFSVISAEVKNDDTVHVFISAPPKISVTSIIRYLKGISGRLLCIEFPAIKNESDGSLWNDSYFVESLGEINENNLKEYIERYENCHL